MDPTLFVLTAITDADARPARWLKAELDTRITTQTLHYRAGDEETAAENVRSLFPLTRKLLSEHQAALAFEVSALFLLNCVVRPNTARWHRWMVDGKFGDEVCRRRFRYEMKGLRPQLQAFAELLGLLSQGAGKTDEARSLFKHLVEQTPAPTRTPDLGGAVRAGIGREINVKETGLHPDLRTVEGSAEFATPDDVNRDERRFIHRRRQALGLEPKTADLAAPLLDATGICLSGGGIRSATFCLGIVQVLARQGLFSQLDYVSTVSGGGYLGAFLSAFLGTPPTAPPIEPDPDVPFDPEEIKEALEDAFEPTGGRESAAVRHLRNNSRYLLNGGVWGRVKVFGLLITGILTNVLLMLPVSLCAVMVVILLNYLHYWGDGFWWTHGRWLISSPAMWTVEVLAAVLALGWFLLPFVRNVARGEEPNSKSSRLRTGWEVTLLGLGLLTLLGAGLASVPAMFRAVAFVREHTAMLGATVRKLADSDALVAGISGAAPFVFGLVAARLKEGRGKWLATLLFSLSGPFFYAVTFLVVGSRVLQGVWPWDITAEITLGLIIWGWLFVDINQFSPHGYYRNRLCECYLAVRCVDETGIVRGLIKRALHGQQPAEAMKETGVGKLAQLPLSRMNATGAAPYHLINTAVNLPASHEPNLRGRESDFYVFSRDYCGGPVCGYVKTKTIEALDRHIDLGTAMAISGAAASTNMGVHTMRKFRFLLALLNVRLGYWMRNPVSSLRNFLNAPGPQYLFREMTGWMHEKSGYLNLSDGGHIENLALYELLRRRCKFIVVVDGGMEPGMECSDLMLAQRYAEIDLGVRFNLDIADLALNAQRRSRAYAVFGKIHYASRANEGETATGGDVGWLLYLKLACVGDEPGYVVDYRRQNPDFPHQSTANQIYDEAQFEAYRRLGECAAESLFRPEITDAYAAPDPATVARDGDAPRFEQLREWFQSLATSLLADNDEAFSSGPAGDGGTPPPGPTVVTPSKDVPVVTNDPGQGG